MKNQLQRLVYAALLTALAIIIPVEFGFLKVQIPPFTATIASHVPMFISMLFGPFTAVIVGFGSAVGFFITSPPVVAARAFMHVFVGLTGALLLQRKVSYTTMLFITAPVHGILEALAVIPFGFTLYKILVVVGIGTIIHHFIDGAIALALIKALAKPLKMKI